MNALRVSEGVRLKSGPWSTAEQLFMAAISPWSVGLPSAELEFAPMQMRSPSPAPVWFTITEPKAAKGQGEDRSAKAWFARRIQYARVEYGMEFMVSPGLARMGV